MELKPETIKEIADNLDSGMLSFYNTATGELEFYPDAKSNLGFDEEPWQDVIDKIDANYGDYIKFEPMPSREAFMVMEYFIANIDHIHTHNKFINAISRKRPFRQFADLLLDYPALREQWFEFKAERYRDYVKDQIGFEDDEDE